MALSEREREKKKYCKSQTIEIENKIHRNEITQLNMLSHIFKCMIKIIKSKYIYIFFSVNSISMKSNKIRAFYDN